MGARSGSEEARFGSEVVAHFGTGGDLDSVAKGHCDIVLEIHARLAVEMVEAARKAHC